MADHAPDPGELIAAAGAVLGETPVEWEELESDSTVVRAALSSGESVIVKHVTDTDFDQPDHEGAPQRFLNEWAGLAFLADLGAHDVAPRLVAADHESGLLVMGDLGERPNLESILLDASGRDARAGLDMLGRSLAGLHAVTARRETDFLARQNELGTGSPLSDSTIDQRERKDLFTACFEDSGSGLDDDVWESIVDAEESIHGSTPFRALIHADSGPQNLLLTEDGGRLIDFEYCVYRNGLLDVAGARLGFPQTTASMVVPDGDVASIETAYRRRICDWIAEAEDDDLFHRSLGAACAHWALNRLAAAWRLHVEPRLPDIGDLADQEAERLAKTVLVLDGFTRFASEFGVYEALADRVARCPETWRARWPQIGQIPSYPALRNDG